ncbi:MAG: sensor domain-containing diguanylate cyclase [Deltaproteobacteria bacterium]|nr:sensor domain-containing diguanylate cyclase [Deltaproteobacteria bacterium]
MVDPTSEEQGQRLAARLRFLHDMATLLAGSRPLAEVLRACVEGAKGLLRAEHAAVVLFDPATGWPAEIHPPSAVLEQLAPGQPAGGGALLARVAQGRVLLSANAAAEPECAADPGGPPAVGPVLGIPVRRGERVAAAVLFARRAGAAAFGEHDRSLAEAVAALASLATRMASWREELDERAQSRATLVINDAMRLLGIGSRRGLEPELAQFHEEARRKRVPYGILIVDVDQLGAYNDRYGRSAGDGVLSTVARLLATAVRAEDRIFRYGQVAVALFLWRLRAAGLATAAERMRRLVIAEGMEHRDRAPPLVTVSAGGAVFDPASAGADALTQGELLHKADDALRRAKRGGGNRVVVSGG